MKKLVRTLIIILAVICAVAAVLTIMFVNKKQTAETAPTDPSTYIIEEPAATYDFYKSEEEVYEIESQRYSLDFPTKWKDKVETTVEETDATYKVTFHAVFEAEKIPLYSFVFGDTQEGYLLGRMKTEEGALNVFLVDLSEAYQGQLSEEDELVYFDMCEAVNDIISNLVYNEGLEIAN